MTLRALSIDASEWFHDPVWSRHLSRRHWRRLASRAAIAIERAVSLCERHGARATFFVTGAIAERHPELLQRLVSAGHEVGNAGHEPVDLDAVPHGDRDALFAAWARSRQAIEAATGQRVRGFRSSWPSQGGEAWWRDTLRAAGYAYDASAPACDGQILHEVSGRSALVLATFVAWELDDEQPRLGALPRYAQRAHHDRLRDAGPRFAAALAERPLAPIADVLRLPREPVAVAMPSREAPPTGAVPGAPRVAIVVPMKDEEEGVPSLIDELDRLACDLRERAACEFVFVDDGSTDRTWELLQQRIAGRTNARAVRHAQNLGVAAAIRTGVLATDAPVIVSIDADLSYDPAEIAPMLALLDGADVVTASPYHPRGSVRNVPGWRLALSRTLSACYRVLVGSPVHTWTACFRACRRPAIADLPLEHPGFLGTAELLVRVLRRGGVVREHPCELQARLFGQSKMRVLRTIRQHVGLLWQVARRRIE